MKTKERVAIFIDGSNLYYRLKAGAFGLPNLTFYDYAGLVDFLAEGREVVFKGYYVGVVRVNQKSPDRVKAEQMQEQQVLLFNHLQSKGQKFALKRGFLMQNDGVFHEKGVDVEIAVDIVRGAYEDTYDTAILISSDTDLIPAIKVAREKGKKVEYVGFSNKPSFALQRNADLSRLLIKSELVRFTMPVKHNKKHTHGKSN